MLRVALPDVFATAFKPQRLISNFGWLGEYFSLFGPAYAYC
jgi:hypothetical protein